MTEMLDDTEDRFAVYYPDGGQVQLDVSEVKGPLHVRWLDINNSRWQNQQNVDGGGTLELKTPGQVQWAVSED